MLIASLQTRHARRIVTPIRMPAQCVMQCTVKFHCVHRVSILLKAYLCMTAGKATRVLASTQAGCCQEREHWCGRVQCQLPPWIPIPGSQSTALPPGLEAATQPQESHKLLKAQSQTCILHVESTSHQYMVQCCKAEQGSETLLGKQRDCCQAAWAV